MIKTDRYVQTEAAGMLYRLIPVTEEIIRCVIGKEEIKGNDSLIIEKKEYPAVEFAAEENEEKLELKTGKVLASLELSSGRIEWKHADGTRWCIQDKADLTKIDVVRYTTGGEKPVINRVKTVDGERNFIQNLKRRLSCKGIFRLEREGRDSRSWPGGGRNLQLSRTQSVSLPAQYEDSNASVCFYRRIWSAV